MFLEIFKRELIANKMLIFWYAIINFATALMYILLFPTMVGSEEALENLMEIFPESMLEVFGITDMGIVTTYEGFMSLEYFSLFWIGLIAAFIITLGRKLVAKEVEDGTSDFLFALPEKRYKIFVAKHASYYLFALFMVAITILFVFAGGVMQGEDLSLANFALLFVIGAAVSCLLLSLTGLFSALFSSGGRAAGVAGAFFLASYVLHIAAVLNETVENFYFLSFFKYYGDTYSTLAEGVFEWSHFLILITTGTILYLASLFVAERRDL